MAIDICIRGSGAVGMTLALLLARSRIRVGLVRSAGQGAARQADIRAFALNSASRAVLSSLRAWPQTDTPALPAAQFSPSASVCPVQHIRVQGDGLGAQAGQVAFDAAATGQEALAWIVDASALEQRLQAALTYAPEITLLDAPEPAPLTVICEGSHSASRQALGLDAGLEFEQTPYLQTAIAATLHTQLPHQATAWQWMLGTGAQHKSAGEVCALLPRSGAAGNSVALVWSVDNAHAKELMALDEAQFCAQLQLACGNALGAMLLTSHRAAWPLQVAQAHRWVGTSLGTGLKTGAAAQPAAWALAGDAAHAVHPLAGQGLNLGLADVSTLAQILADKASFRSFGDMRLLRQYERARKGDAAALRLATDGLQRLFALDDPRVRALRNWGMRGFDAISPLKTLVMRQAMGKPLSA